MTIDWPELGRRLKLAREASGLTQEQAGEHLGVARASVTQMELGNRAVSAIELEKLAFLYGRDMRSFFAEEFSEKEPLVVLFRGHPELADEAVAERLRHFVSLAREIRNLEELLALPPEARNPARYDAALPQSKWDAVVQGNRIADEERRRLQLGDGPIASLSELLGDQGVRVITGQDLPAGVSGLTLSVPGAGLLVVIGKERAERQRFSLSHEYAHVLLDRERGDVVSRAGERDEPLEVRANAFAAAFLMPEGGVRRFLASLGRGEPSRQVADVFGEASGQVRAQGRPRPGSQRIQIEDVVQLAHHFGVSRLAALYRLRNLRPAVLSDDEFEVLEKDSERRGNAIARALTLSDLPSEEGQEQLSSRLLALAIDACRQELVSKRKVLDLARKLGLPASAMKDLSSLLEDIAQQEGGDEVESLVPRRSK